MPRHPVSALRRPLDQLAQVRSARQGHQYAKETGGSRGAGGTSPDQTVRFQIGATIRPRRCAITSITMPVVVHSTSASTEDSTPKSPPVR